VIFLRRFSGAFTKIYPLEDNMTTIQNMLVEPTAHSIIDSGGIYGRSYQRNAERDFDKEPQAILKIGKYGVEVTVNTKQHLDVCLAEDDLCEAFNALPCEDWDGGYGLSQKGLDFLNSIGAEIENSWNSYNWENNFDQTLQGYRIDIHGEEYTLLQVHGGCDVRSGYTDAKLFRVEEPDYWMHDDTSFGISREDAEAAGYPEQPCTYCDSDEIYVKIYGYYGSDTQAYDPRASDDVDLPDDFWDKLRHQTIEGVQDAIEH